MAIKIRTVYVQNKNAQYSDDKAFSRELERYGELSTELSIRGRVKGFDDEYCDLFEELGETMTNLSRGPNTASKTMVAKYEEAGVKELTNQLLDYES